MNYQINTAFIFLLKEKFINSSQCDIVGTTEITHQNKTKVKLDSWIVYFLYFCINRSFQLWVASYSIVINCTSYGTLSNLYVKDLLLPFNRTSKRLNDSSEASMLTDCMAGCRFFSVKSLWLCMVVSEAESVRKWSWSEKNSRPRTCCLF